MTGAATDRFDALADGKFREALTLHRESRLDEAARAYRQVLERQPKHVHALNFLGVIAFQADDLERALEFTARALEVDPHQLGAHLIQGHALVRVGQYEAALASYMRAIQLKPDFVDAHLHCGSVLDRLGRHAQALVSYDRALQLDPTLVEAHNNRGNALRTLQQYDGAIASYERVIALVPQLPEPYFNRGLAQHELGRYGAALASFDQALAIHPRYAEAHYARGNVLKDLREFRAALASYDQAIAIKGDCAEAHSNRGNVLFELERFDDALASYGTALSLIPGHVDAHYNRGRLLYDLGRHEEALTNLDRAIAVDPEHAPTHVARAFVCLRRGDLARGWREFEWRWQDEDSGTSRERRSFPQPLWSGDECLHGKTVLVYCEQGLGDTIQFCRYARLIAERGAKVILELPQALDRLLRSLPGVGQCVPRGEALPPFDYHCPLLSLPLALKTTLDTVPSGIPYLRAHPERVQAWREKVGERSLRRVGLVWSGGFRADQPELWGVNARRNIPLAKLAALKHPKIEFYSLQKGEAAEAELAALLGSGWDGPSLVNHTGELHNFEETAALIEQLDLVISVDTSTAHLAGALGKPVWLLNRYDSCWRWLWERTDSPWYPTLRLYRQKRRGDWEDVVRQVCTDLDGFTRRP